MKAISDRLKEGMELRQLKQVDIVKKTGINKGALSSYLSGKYEPKQNNIYLLAKALDVNEAWLMGHDVPMDRKYTLKNITPDYLQSNPKLKDSLFEATKNLINSYATQSDISIVDILKDEDTSDDIKAQIYNDVFEEIKYDEDNNSIDVFISIPFGDTNVNSEDILIHKYKLLDDKGRHTVDTVLEMEYNRCISQKENN